MTEQALLKIVEKIVDDYDYKAQRNGRRSTLAFLFGDISLAFI